MSRLLLDFAVVTHSHIFRSYFQIITLPGAYCGDVMEHEGVVNTVVLTVGDQISMTLGHC